MLKPAKCRQAEVVTLQGPKVLSSFLETSPDAHSRLSSNIQIVKKRLRTLHFAMSSNSTEGTGHNEMAQKPSPEQTRFLAMRTGPTHSCSSEESASGRRCRDVPALFSL